MAGIRKLVLYQAPGGQTWQYIVEPTGSFILDGHIETGVHSYFASAWFGYPTKPKGYLVIASRNPFIQDPTGLVAESSGYNGENYIYGSGGSSGSPAYSNTFALWYWNPYPSAVSVGPQFAGWPNGFPYTTQWYSGLSYPGYVRFDTAAAAWINWAPGLAVLGTITLESSPYHQITHVVPEYASLYWVQHSGSSSVLTRWGGAYGASHPRYPVWDMPAGNGDEWTLKRPSDVSVGF